MKNDVLEIALRLAEAGCKMPHPTSLVVSERMQNLSALFDYIGNIAAAGCFKAIGEEVAALEAEMTRLKSSAADTARLDWLQQIKDADFGAVNGHAHAISKVSLFTVASQRVIGDSVRDAIDLAMKVAP